MSGGASTTAKPVLTFQYDKRRLRLTALMVVGTALLFALVTLLSQQWAGWLMTIPVAALAVYCVIQTRDRRTILAIGPHGLMFLPFSSRTVPWSEITAVAVVRGVQRGVAWGKVHYKASPTMDQVAFELRSYEGYSGAVRGAFRSLQAFGGKPGVGCYVWQLEGGNVDEIARAIHAYWSGTIQDMVARQGMYESVPWTGTPPTLG